MVGKRGWLSTPIIVSSLLLVVAFSSSLWAQGLPQSPYSAPSVVREGGLDLAPSNPLGMPGTPGGLPRGSDSVLITPQLLQGILPAIPNLQFGYLYNFGRSVGSGRLTADYVLPISLGLDSAVFGEAHTEWQDFWKGVQGGANTRTDISVGGGYRRMLGNNLLVGVNAFYDTTRLGRPWYGSFGFGAEMAATIAGNDAFDLNFNWYGHPHNDILYSIFRRGTGNYDFGAGYSHELYGGGPDLRLKATGYRFGVGSGVYGWRTGAELKSRDGVFSLKYETGHDRLNKTYHTVGGFVNVGFQLENLFNGESPFVMPEPIFRSPRNLRRLLTSKVRRNWHQPGSAVVATNVATQDECGGYESLGHCTVGDTELYTRTFIPVTPPFEKHTNGAITVRMSWCGVTNVTPIPGSFIGSLATGPGGDAFVYGQWPHSPEFTSLMADSSGQVDLSFRMGSDHSSWNGWYVFDPGGSSQHMLDIEPGGYICFEILD